MKNPAIYIIILALLAHSCTSDEFENPNEEKFRAFAKTIDNTHYLSASQIPGFIDYLAGAKIDDETFVVHGEAHDFNTIMYHLQGQEPVITWMKDIDGFTANTILAYEEDLILFGVERLPSFENISVMVRMDMHGEVKYRKVIPNNHAPLHPIIHNDHIFAISDNLVIEIDGNGEIIREIMNTDIPEARPLRLASSDANHIFIIYRGQHDDTFITQYDLADRTFKSTFLYKDPGCGAFLCFNEFRMSPTSEGGVVILRMGTEKVQDLRMYLTNVNRHNDINWSRNWIFNYTDFNDAGAMTVAQSGEILVSAPYQRSIEQRDAHLMVTRISPDGKTIWRNAYETSRDCDADGIMEMADGNILVLGDTHIPYHMLLDKDGNTL